MDLAQDPVCGRLWPLEGEGMVTTFQPGLPERITLQEQGLLAASCRGRSSATARTKRHASHPGSLTSGLTSLSSALSSTKSEW